LARDQWFPVSGNVPIAAQLSLSYLLNQMVPSQFTAAIAIAKTSQLDLWVAPAKILAPDQWFPVSGNVPIVVHKSLSYLLNQMAPNQFTVVIAIAIADQLDQVDTNNKKSPPGAEIFYLFNWVNFFS
jgi:hypothetical protein